MNFDPQKFFIGLIDFFSILLPGALLTYTLRTILGPLLLGSGYQDLTEAEGWAIFLFSSYLLGHFVFLIGSKLDETLYKTIRYATDLDQIERLSKGETLSPGLARFFARLLLKEEQARPGNLVEKIKEYHLQPLNGDPAVNIFQWSKAWLTLEYPQAMVPIQRFEANSKFFRSLLVVLLIFLIGAGIAGNLIFVITSLVLLFPALWGYIDQRVKGMNTGFWYVITLESQREGGYRSMPEEKGDLTHAGGVVYRRRGTQWEYLLVQSSHGKQWVLPKGQRKTDEKMKETAVREVREESGVWARVIEKLNAVQMIKKGKPIMVQFYLMEALETGRPQEKRARDWVSYAEALDRVSPKQSVEPIQLAEEILQTQSFAILQPDPGDG